MKLEKVEKLVPNLKDKKTYVVQIKSLNSSIVVEGMRRKLTTIFLIAY